MEMRRKDAGGGKVQAEGGGDDPTAKIDDAVKKAVEAADAATQDDRVAGEGGADSSAHSTQQAESQNVREATGSADDSSGDPDSKDDSVPEEAVKNEGAAEEVKAEKDEKPEEKKAAAKAKAEDEKPKKDVKAKEPAKPKKPAAKKAEKAPTEAPAPAVVRATAKYVRVAPRKARLIADQVRGMHIDEARALLAFSPRNAALDIKKLIESAAANAENNHDLIADEMRVTEIRVDEGPTIKRYRPRAQGRATAINKRTSHISVALSPEE